MPINDYFLSVEASLHQCPFQIAIDFKTEVFDLTKGYFKAKITFWDNSVLFLFEYVLIEKNRPEIITYRYHHQDSNAKLIQRWDNAPHYPGLPHFPEHLHSLASVSGCNRPEIDWVLEQAGIYLLRQ